MVGKLPKVVGNDNKFMESLLGRTLSHGELPTYVTEDPEGEMGEADHDEGPREERGEDEKEGLSIVWRASPEMAILRSAQSPSLYMVEASTSRKTARTTWRRAIERSIAVVGGKAVAVVLTREDFWRGDGGGAECDCSTDTGGFLERRWGQRGRVCVGV